MLPVVCFPEHMLHNVPQVVGMSVPHIADQSWDGVSFVLVVVQIGNVTSRTLDLPGRADTTIASSVYDPAHVARWKP